MLQKANKIQNQFCQRSIASLSILSFILETQIQPKYILYRGLVRNFNPLVPLNYTAVALRLQIPKQVLYEIEMIWVEMKHLELIAVGLVMYLWLSKECDSTIKLF